MKLSTVGLALAGALVLAGCSAAPSNPAPTGAASSAPTSAAATPTPTAPATGATVDKAALTKQLEDAQASLNSVHMAMNTKASVSGMSFDVAMVGDMDVRDKANPRGSLSMTGPMPLEMIMDAGGVYYIKTAALGNQWYKATKDDLGSGVPDPAGQASGYTELLKSADKVVFVGEETIEDTPTKHYTLSVPKSSASVPGASAAPSASGEMIPVELYVTAQNYVKKFTMTMTDPVVATDVVLSKFNEPVTITIPTDAQPFPKR